MNYPSSFNGKRDQLVCLASGCSVFLISLVVFQHYTKGDQYAYTNAYQMVSGLGFGDPWEVIRIVYWSYVSSIEPVHLMVSLVGGGLDISKNLLMSVFNGILAAYSVRLFLSWGASIWIATGLVVTNYYFYVLYFPAERLKFAFLFLVLMFLCTKNRLYRVSFALMSFLSHFSFLFIYLGIWVSRIPNELLKWKHLDYSILILPPLAMGVLWFSYGEYILWKVNQYLQPSGSQSVYIFLPVTLLLTFSCMYAKRNWEPLLAFLPVLVGVALLGGSRLNMIGFFIFLYFGMQTKGGLNVGMIGLMVYFCYKTVGFLESIYLYNDGFVR